MNRGMRRGAIISFGFHALLILAAIIVLPVQPLPTAPDSQFDIEMVGPSVPQEGKEKGKTPAPDKAPTVTSGHEADKAPKPQPIVAPPPPPPPPPPAPDKAPALPKPPAPAPPPPPPVQTPSVAPTPPPPPPQPPQKLTSTVVQPKIPLPPIPQPPAPAQSLTHQQHVVKAPQPLSQTVLNTLQNLKSTQPQVKPPTAQYNPEQGGAPDAGGVQSTANSRLSGADKNAIGAHVRPCWGIDASAPGVATFSVHLIVQTDAGGTVHNAVIAPVDQSRMGDPIYNAFASRAIDAVMNYQCATLPLPSYMLGQPQTFEFLFSP